MKEIQLMDGCLIKIADSHKFTTYLFRLANGNVGKVFTGPQYRNFYNWKDLRNGDLVSGLVWYDEVKKILNADSPVHITPSTIGIQ